MSVEFPGEKYSSVGVGAPKTPIMVKWVMKTGLVKDKTQANIVLIVIAVVFFITTFLLMSDFSGPKTQQAYIEDIPEDVRATLPPEILKTIPSRN